MKSMFDIFIVILIGTGMPVLGGSKTESPELRLLQEGRRQFSLSVEAENHIEPAVTAFTGLGSQFPQYAGRVQVYLGALDAIKGKHRFWPHQKVAQVNKALDIMEDGLRQSPNDLEALFVYANINYNLPFFFGRKELGRTSYKKIVRLLPHTVSNYDPPFIVDMTDYMLQNLDWSQKDRAVLEQVRQEVLNFMAGV